jgi:hypothetical protein
VPSAVIRGSNELDDLGVKEVSKFHILSNVSHLFYFLICRFLRFLHYIFVKVSHCVTVWYIHGCHFWDTCHTCQKYQDHVLLVIICVIGGVLVTNFNKVLKVWWGGSKSGFKAFGDYLEREESNVVIM